MDEHGRRHIDQLKATADPERIAEALGLQRRGRRFFCPACQPEGGKSPDLSTSGGGFHCFKCGLKGDALALVQLAGGMDFPAAVAWLESYTGISSPPWKPSGGCQVLPRSIPAVATKMPGATEKDAVFTPDTDVSAALGAYLEACEPLEGRALDWLTDKGVSLDVVANCRLRFCGRQYPDIMDQLKGRFGEATLEAAGLLKQSKGRLVPSFWHYYAKQTGFIVIPYIRAGNVVYLKGRPPCDKASAEARGLIRFMNTTGTIPCLYNVDAISARPPPDRVVICEGESDTWAALSAGWPAVGSPGAQQFKPAWTEGFRQLVTPEGRSRVYLAADGDAAGQAGARIIADYFLKAGLPVPYRLAMAEGMDLTDYLRKE